MGASRGHLCHIAQLSCIIYVNIGSLIGLYGYHSTRFSWFIFCFDGNCMSFIALSSPARIVMFVNLLYLMSKINDDDDDDEV